MIVAIGAVHLLLWQAFKCQAFAFRERGESSERVGLFVAPVSLCAGGAGNGSPSVWRHQTVARLEQGVQEVTSSEAVEVRVPCRYLVMSRSLAIVSV